ncbi:hypothetical protein EV426DRAFT_671004 [Tirmania nivea]|nr:hypothetical protein EV426DRAFT_671004 [Tirmania nivea]
MQGRWLSSAYTRERKGLHCVLGIPILLLDPNCLVEASQAWGRARRPLPVLLTCSDCQCYQICRSEWKKQGDNYCREDKEEWEEPALKVDSIGEEVKQPEDFELVEKQLPTLWVLRHHTSDTKPSYFLCFKEVYAGGFGRQRDDLARLVRVLVCLRRPVCRSSAHATMVCALDQNNCHVPEWVDCSISRY